MGIDVPHEPSKRIKAKIEAPNIRVERDLPEKTSDYLEVPHIDILVSLVESNSGWGMTRQHIRTVGS